MGKSQQTITNRFQKQQSYYFQLFYYHTVLYNKDCTESCILFSKCQVFSAQRNNWKGSLLLGRMHPLPRRTCCCFFQSGHIPACPTDNLGERTNISRLYTSKLAALKLTCTGGHACVLMIIWVCARFLGGHACVLMIVWGCARFLGGMRVC